MTSPTNRWHRCATVVAAAALAVPFSVFDCRAALPLLQLRLEQRRASGADPAETDATVLERLCRAEQPLDERERAIAIVAGAAHPVPLATQAQRWRAAACHAV